MRKLKKSVGLAAVAALAVSLTACSTHYTDPSMVALRYAGGVSEGGKFKECVEPGTKKLDNDSYYPYPTTQREDVWDTDNYIEDKNGDGLPEGSADQKDLQVIDKDGNLANLKVKVSFSLNTDCDVLRVFHEKIGKTRGAYFNDDGTYNAGWIWAMTNYIGSAVEASAKTAATSYSVDEMWLDPAVREKIAQAMMETVQKAVNDGMEGKEQFYTIGSVRVFGASPSEEFTKLYEERKAASVKAETAKANEEAQVAEARAKAKVAKAEAEARRAEIGGFGGSEAYLKYLMIQKGMNPYQRTYTGSVTTTD